MEILKKTILQAVIMGSNVTGGTIIIPDLSAVYFIKIGLKQFAHDLGFFTPYSEPPEPIPPIPPVETFYLVDSASNPFVDNNDDNFIYE